VRCVRRWNSEAISFIVKSKVSAAVLDYRLQVGDTLSVARMLAERRIPFLFETSDPDSVAGKYPGAVILAKPFRAGPAHISDARLARADAKRYISRRTYIRFAARN
jgi:hypothetical protein